MKNKLINLVKIIVEIFKKENNSLPEKYVNIEIFGHSLKSLIKIILIIIVSIF